LYGLQILVDNSGIIAVNGINSDYVWITLAEIEAISMALSK